MNTATATNERYEMDTKTVNVSTPGPLQGQDSALAYHADKAERHAPSIMKIRHRIEGVLSRLTGPNEEPPAEDEKAAGNLLERLDNVNARNSLEISQLAAKISELEALA